MEENDYSAITAEPADPDSSDEGQQQEIVEDVPTAGDSAAFLILEKLHVSFNQLERSLKLYESSPSLESAEPLTFSSLPVVEEIVEVAAAPAPGTSSVAAISDLPGAAAPEAPEKEAADPAADVYAIPELAPLGRTFRSTPATPLTELETEYVVTCVKHIFEANVVLQFIIQNTIDDQKLTNVTVALDGDSEVSFREKRGRRKEGDVIL